MSRILVKTVKISDMGGVIIAITVLHPKNRNIHALKIPYLFEYFLFPGYLR